MTMFGRHQFLYDVNNFPVQLSYQLLGPQVRLAFMPNILPSPEDSLFYAFMKNISTDLPSLIDGILVCIQKFRGQLFKASLS